jgi:hypothetical protein
MSCHFVGGGGRISHRTLDAFVLRGDHIAFVSVYQDLAAITGSCREVAGTLVRAMIAR